MIHKKSEEEIKVMLEERDIVLKEISSVKKELYKLQQTDKFLKFKIYSGCKHEWVNAVEYSSYDDRYKKCLKCKFVR
tara:strand:- start:553 stop:783 length:231 start_codon:yes stop_codon:yes gene_type:complete